MTATQNVPHKIGSGPIRPLKYPHPQLERTAEDIDPESKDAQYIIKQLIHTMATRTWGGVAGMAAPQIGYSKRIFVVQMYGPFHPKLGRRITNGPKAFINPRIIEASYFFTAYEGCFSLEANKFDYEVKRPKKLTLEYQDINGETHREDFNGHAAQVIAHEYDHLEGRLCHSYEGGKRKTAPGGKKPTKTN